MCVIVKNRCFFSFTTNSQSKLKRISTLFLRHLPKISIWNLTRFYGGLFGFEILEIFTTAFLLKTIIWTWTFFKYSRVLSLNTKAKSSQKRCNANHLKIAWHRKRQKTNIEQRERKGNMRKSKTATIIFCLLLLFYVYIVTFVLQFFRVTGYSKNAVIKHQRPYRYALVL